jgi:hypothetical protein
MANPYMKYSIALLAIVLSSFAHFEAVPFNREMQPMPSGEDWKGMMPAKLGAFERIAFQAPQPNNDGSAYYKKGKQVVFVSFIKLADDKQLKEYISVAKGDMMRATADERKTETSGDTRYVYYRQNDKVFFAWNRGLYYFDVMCEGDTGVFDEFMTVFPY